MGKRQFIIVGAAIGLFVVMFLLGGYFGSKGSKPPAAIVKSPPKLVQTTQVVYGEVLTNIVTYGRVESSQPIDLIAEVSGRIIGGSTRLKQSQSFTKGQLLYRIDDAEARLNLKSQKSNFLRDLATILPDLKIDFPDSYTQWNSYFQSIDIDRPLPEMPGYKTDKEKTFLATKNIFSTYFDIKSAETNLNKHSVYAPFNGSFTEVSLESGAYVNPGNKIARIVRTGKLELKVPVDAADINWVSPGGKVEVTTEDGLTSWQGKIQRIGEIVNQTTQSIDVVIDLVPNEHTVYDGLYLKAVIPGKPITNAFEIDRSAFYQGSKVYVVEQDSLLKVKDVEVHRINNETVVFSGLDAGSQIIVEPLINAFNNMLVTTQSEEDSAENQ